MRQGASASTPKPGGNFIGLFKGNADLPLAEAVGVGAHRLLGKPAPFLPDGDGGGGADAARGQKFHDRPHPEDAPERFAQLDGLLRGDSPDLGQPGGVVFQHLKGAVPEFGDDFLRQRRADSADRPAREIAQHRGGGGGHHPLEAARLELAPVARMGGEGSGGGDLLTGGKLHRFADHRHQLVVHRDLHDGEAGFLRMKDD